MKTVAIIGGGFSGSLIAVNLARLAEHPRRVVIINAKRPLGRGTAYGTARPEHLLNVAARNMSALPDLPTHFVDWLQTRSEFAGVPEKQLREMFAPRRVYGDYVRGLLNSCLHPIDARSQVRVEAIEGEATDVYQDAEGRANVQLSDGETVAADQVVLATGNQPPGCFPAASALNHEGRYCGDPWDDWQRRLPPAGGRIVLLGTGLTMVDVVLTLGELGWEGQIVAVSRHGRLPHSHFRGIAYEDYVPAGAESLGLKGLVRLVKQHCQRLQQMSQNSAIAIDKLRPHTQRLWQSLSTEEKREFLVRYAAEWNVTRHRIAVSIHETITDALDTGRLQIVTGCIEQLVSTEPSLDVVVRDPDDQPQRVSADLVINCTGPQSCFSRTRLPLFENLLGRGLVRCDDLDMGIAVDQEFAVRDTDGVASDWLYAMGPLLKGTLWETTAVPELRGQAMRVAEVLLQREPAEWEEEAILEYYI